MVEQIVYILSGEILVVELRYICRFERDKLQIIMARQSCDRK